MVGMTGRTPAQVELDSTVTDFDIGTGCFARNRDKVLQSRALAE
jgi:hypothetical protein